MLKTYNYAIFRVVPRVERGEFVNVGVILYCSSEKFLEVLVDISEAKIRALDPKFDLEPIRENLASISSICGGTSEPGPLSQLSLRERFDWLVAPRSSSLQTSPVHSGRSADLKLALKNTFETMVQSPSPL